ncbi:Uncharacterised protein [Acinetobacter baumannii]|nr:Uncharacterised protein [Acinetobacter baumannii]
MKYPNRLYSHGPNMESNQQTFWYLVQESMHLLHDYPLLNQNGNLQPFDQLQHDQVLSLVQVDQHKVYE